MKSNKTSTKKVVSLGKVVVGMFGVECIINFCLFVFEFRCNWDKFRLTAHNVCTFSHLTYTCIVQSECKADVDGANTGRHALFIMMRNCPHSFLAIMLVSTLDCPLNVPNQAVCSSAFHSLWRIAIYYYWLIF